MPSVAASQVRIAICVIALALLSAFAATSMGLGAVATPLVRDYHGERDSTPLSGGRDSTPLSGERDSEPLLITIAGEIPANTLEARTRAVAGHIAQVSVRIETNDGMGSGTIVARDGIILTSAHVVEGCTSIDVCTSTGRLFRARALGSNGQGDLTLLKVDARFTQVAAAGNSQLLALGSWVLASGHPTSAFDDFQPSLSIGRVRELEGSIDAGEDKSFRQAIVSDVPLSAGSSGGGLFNLNGRLIGVNAAVTRNERRAFSVRIEEYLVDADRLRRGEHFNRVPPRRGSAKSLGPTRRAWFDARWRQSAAATIVDGRWAQLHLKDGLKVSALHVSSKGDLMAAASSLAPSSYPIGARIEVRRGKSLLGQATLVGRDLAHGVVLLRLPERPFAAWSYFDLAATAGVTSAARGSLVMVPGRSSYYGGIIASALRRPPNEMRGHAQSGFWPQVLQCDMRLGRSHLGAPVVTRQGELLGMVLQHRLRLSKSRWEREPYGNFVLPRYALAESHRILSRQSLRPAPKLGYFGIGLEDLTQGELRRLRLPGAARVHTVEPGWPADLGGIRHGDLILAIDGESVRGRAPAIEFIAALPTGRRVSVTLLRNHQRVHCFVKAGERHRRPRAKLAASR
ncbi:MAG: trypsin-like peptidase domain-containing protein [Planctomycetota bacterium]